MRDESQARRQGWDIGIIARGAAGFSEWRYPEMGRGRGPELLESALQDLDTLDYDCEVPWPLGSFGKNVRVLEKDGESFKALIQTRSYQTESSRYWMGIVVPDLKRVDRVVL